MENRAAYGNFTGADTLATTPPTAGCPARSLAVVAARRFQIGRLSVRCRAIGRLLAGIAHQKPEIASYLLDTIDRHVALRGGVHGADACAQKRQAVGRHGRKAEIELAVPIQASVPAVDTVDLATTRCRALVCVD